MIIVIILYTSDSANFGNVFFLLYVFSYDARIVSPSIVLDSENFKYKEFNLK